MTLKEFEDKYLGSRVEFHSNGGSNTHYQCVDLVNQYIQDVLGLTPVIGTNAKDFPKKINRDEFDVIKNTPDFIPEYGDIVVWSGHVGGGAGHIAIVNSNEATINLFHSLDQNWSIIKQVTKETHNYKRVTYFLRPKGDTMSDDALKSCLSDREKFWKERDEALEEANKLSSEVSKLTERVKQERKLKEQELEQQKNELSQQCDKRINESKERVISQYESKIKDLEDQVSSIEGGSDNWISDFKKRLSSRKFITTLIAMIMPVIAGIMTIIGVEYDAEQLQSVIFGLFGIAGLFIVPEAYTDHVSRIKTLNNQQR